MERVSGMLGRGLFESVIFKSWPVIRSLFCPNDALLWRNGSKNFMLYMLAEFTNLDGPEFEDDEIAPLCTSTTVPSCTFWPSISLPFNYVPLCSHPH